MRKLNFLVLSLIFTLLACNDKYPDLKDGIYAEIKTNEGIVVADLHFEETPLTVANFVSLAEGTQDAVNEEYKGKKFYDGLIFHRVIKDFMIQGGDPMGVGTGGPGYKFSDEIVKELNHDKKGILSMANSGKNTNGSQFFITLKPTQWLDGKHTVFGEVVLGQEIVDKIGVTQTDNKDKPKKDIVIETVTIYRKGDKAKAFDAPSTFKETKEKLDEAAKIAKEQKAKEMAEAKIRAEKKAGEDKLRFEEMKKGSKKLKSGLQVVVTEKGTGDNIKTGDNVGVFYAGYLEDGTLFDTNIEEIAKLTGSFNERRLAMGGYKPMAIPFSQQAPTIPGFKEGLLSLKKVGDKATLFIPSELGYGAKGGGPIPPNANLIFEIKIEEIKK